MNLKHIKNVTETQAEIRLFDTIGAGRSTGSEIAEEIAWLIDHQDVKEILVRINSGGGSMIEGFGIFSALHNAKKKGVKVNVSIEGLAASMAGIIAMVGDKITMVDFGVLMIHDPNMGGSEPNEKQQEILNKLKNSAVKIMSNRTGISADDISEMMSEETWLEADEALAKGFIDEIESTTIDNIEKEAAQMEFLEICMSLSKKVTKPNMKNILSHFNLTEGTQEDVLAAIDKIESKASELEKENSGLIETITSHNDEIAKKDVEIASLGERILASDKNIVKTLFNEAVKAGKIKKDSVEGLIETCGSDSVLAEKLINSVVVPAVNVITNFIKKTDGTAPVEMGFREMEKSDPKKLENIKATNPELYKEVYLNEYKTEY